MRKRILILLCILSLVFPASAFAQDAINIDSVMIEFWPEYDQQAMLIIYNIVLAQDTALPAILQIEIPAVVGEPNAVAMGNASGSGLVLAPYERQEFGGTAIITLETSSNIVQLEYYAPLPREGDVRTFSGEYILAYPVNDFSLRMQQPIGATDLKFEPDFENLTQGADGLNYYRHEIGPVAANQPVSVSLSYTKTNDTLTRPLFSPSSDSGTATDTPTATPAINDFNWGVTLLAAAGVGLIGYGIFRMIRENEEKKRAEKRKRRPRPSKSEQSAKSAPTVFCHNCGTQSQPGDKFCRECGVKLRIP